MKNDATDEALVPSATYVSKLGSRLRVAADEKQTREGHDDDNADEEFWLTKKEIKVLLSL